jgi:hypothetical protein
MYTFSDLTKTRTYAFYLRVLISNFLRISVSDARKIVENLHNVSNDEFITTLQNHHNKYIQKTSLERYSHKSIYNNHKVHLTNVLSTFNINNINNYLDFGCSDGMKLTIISDILNVTNKFGLDLDGQNNYYTYDGKHLPESVISQKYDLITSFQVLHHVDPNHITFILEQLISCIEVGGYFLLKEHDFFAEWIKTLIDLQHLLFTIDKNVDYPVLIYNSQDEWVRVFEQLGMKLIDIYVDNPTCKMHFYALFQKI